MLPRLHLLEAAGWGPDRVDRWLLNAAPTGYRLEGLSAFGVPPERVVVVHPGVHYRLEVLVAPTRRPRHWDPAPWAAQAVRRRLPVAPAPAAVGPRLWLDRSTCAFRRLRDPAPVQAALRRRGFIDFAPEQHPPAVQRAAFAAAEAVVAVHGSALTNLLFVPPGRPVLELMASNYVDLSFWAAATISGLHHAVLAGGPLEPEGVDSRARFDDVPVDLAALEQALDWVEAARTAHPGPARPR